MFLKVRFIFVVKVTDFFLLLRIIMLFKLYASGNPKIRRSLKCLFYSAIFSEINYSFRNCLNQLRKCLMLLEQKVVWYCLKSWYQCNIVINFNIGFSHTSHSFRSYLSDYSRQKILCLRFFDILIFNFLYFKHFDISSAIG